MAFTGVNTKIILNSNDCRKKTSRMEKLSNIMVVYIFLIQSLYAWTFSIM